MMRVAKVSQGHRFTARLKLAAMKLVTRRDPPDVVRTLMYRPEYFGAPMGEPKFRYYAEWEFPDMDAFKAAARTEEFMATGKDAMDMGVPFQVHFATVE